MPRLNPPPSPLAFPRPSCGGRRRWTGLILGVSVPFMSLLPGGLAAAGGGDDDGHEHEDLPVSLELPTLEAKPGDTIRVPVGLRSEVGVSLAAFSVEYQPGVISVASSSLSEELQLYLETQPDADSSFVWHGDDLEGWIQTAIVIDYLARPEKVLPAGAAALAELEVHIPESAEPGTVPLKFTRRESAHYEGELKDAQQASVYNWVRREGSEFEEESEFEDGDEPTFTDGAILIGLVGEVDVFARGDANGDRQVDIADPTRILMHLFFGAEEPGCADAADANDDGRLDLSDSVVILDYLFNGQESAYPLSGAPGKDTTPDNLGCTVY